MADAKTKEVPVNLPDVLHQYAVTSSDYSRPFLLGCYPTLDAAILAQGGKPERWEIFSRLAAPQPAASAGEIIALRQLADQWRKLCYRHEQTILDLKTSAASDVPHDVVREARDVLRHLGILTGQVLRPWTAARAEEAAAQLDAALATLAPSTSTEEALRAENARLREAAQAVLDAETVYVHVGYDDAAGGGNFVYADAIRTDDEAFTKLRSALSR